MKTTRASAAWILLAFVAAVEPLAAQPPRIVNAKIETHSAAGGLEKEFHAIADAQREPVWMGYEVPAVPGNHSSCCGDSVDGVGDLMCCRRCNLEGSSSAAVEPPAPGRVNLEPPDRLLVLFRIEQKAVQKIRVFSPDCELDGGGLAFHWLTDVRPPESIAWLARLVTAPVQGTERETREGRRIPSSALTAIALHADPAADRVLEQFTVSGAAQGSVQPEWLRGRAAFWLGVARGRRGYEVLSRLVRDDPTEHVREQAVFALAQSKEPEALNPVIAVARSDRSPQVRGRALFWLAQKAGKKAAATITEAIEKDPETEVKKRAVFALSRLPKDEGVPLLIQVARTNPNPAVRRQAMFWLGQSKDSRALAFFEEVLAR